MTDKSENRPVLVTTEYGGVFFGYLLSQQDSTVVLARARNCISWAGVSGFLGLATDGPNERCRIGPAAPTVELHRVASISDCTEAAVAAWGAASWKLD